MSEPCDDSTVWLDVPITPDQMGRFEDCKSRAFVIKDMEIIIELTPHPRVGFRSA